MNKSGLSEYLNLTDNPVIYVGGEPRVVVDGEKSLIRIDENGTTMKSIAQQVRQRNRYIFSSVNTDTDGNVPIVTTAGVFHIEEYKFSQAWINKLDIYSSIVTGSEGISDITPEKIETLKISSITGNIIVLAGRQLTLGELEIIKSVGTVKQYMRVIQNVDDKERVNTIFKIVHESDLIPPE